MSSRRPGGSKNSTSTRHNEHAAMPPAPTTHGHGDGGSPSQQFPIPDVTAAIASYLATQSPQPPQPDTRPPRAPVCINTPSPQPWPPQHHHRIASPPWPFAPAFVPPAPPIPLPSWSTTVTRPNMMVSHPLPGCLRVARRAGHEAAGEGRNFLLSPLSLHAALALVAAGARGETQRELLGFLGSGSVDELQRAAATRLVTALRDLPETSFACGVWVDRRQALRPEFVEVAGAVYAAVVESVDFVSQAGQARQGVNAFVADATKGLIRDVLPAGSVDSSTVLVLANALYFKGTWAQPFDPSMTFTAPFRLTFGAAVRAPFMTSVSEHHVAVFPSFKALKLPYKNDGNLEFYMLLLLPDGEALTVTDLFDKAISTPGFIRKHTPVAKVPVGRFMVPKFRFTFEFEASKDMQNLGISRAFGGGDFSSMVAGGDGVFISGVHHKATVEVDEVGTVAAAATVVSMYQCGSARPPVDFVANRPFLFAVVEEWTGALLFFGQVVNPLVPGGVISKSLESS